MPLNKNTRIKKILEVKSQQVVGTQKIEWKGEPQWLDVYRVPISYLIYNKYNGRILSRTKSLETQNQKLNAEIEKDFKTIEELLYASHENRNKQTEANIRKKGQEKPGIITSDGVVIDGNRRLMCLNRIVNKPEKLDTEKFKYFEAVILPANLADVPDEIRRLETTYQMGEDKKLDYNPIEKYLKVQELDKNKISISSISDWMSETELEVTKYLDTMRTMDDYLDYLDYNGIYTQLDGREDWFLSLTKWLKGFKGEGSKRAFDGYKEADVDDLQLVCYDYIRAKHGGDEKRFRKIAEGQQSNHIFGNRELWGKFKNFHFERTDPIKDKELPINHDAPDLKSHLDDRDKQFMTKSGQHLKENLNDRISELSNKQNQNEPEKLINKAESALEAINIKADSFSKEDTQKQLRKVVNKATELLLKNDVSLVLKQSFDLLDKIDINDLSNEEGDKQLDLIKQINSLSFEMKKKLGG
ncbi:hypothetical protein BSPLISOX_142 [uncultured Gammaproteobacteria bacterium]|jgi:hypothetical protein|nr:hypothetical protein BSPLISOX_142 [uncultured Gammaproteobacteria bacterium]